MSNEHDWVFDPFLGVGTAIIAAIRHNRRGAGAEVVKKYIEIAHERIQQEVNGILRTRPMRKPVYDPNLDGNKLTIAPRDKDKNAHQRKLLEKNKGYSRV